MNGATVDSARADMTTDQLWWRRRTSDILSLATSIRASPIRWQRNMIDWSGIPWDGRSALRVGDVAVPANDVRQLVANLELQTERLRQERVTAPAAKDVRVAITGPNERECLTIDVDLADFILPIAVEVCAFANGPASLTRTVSEVMQHVEAAVRNRRTVARREVALRGALEKTAARIGAGCVPLWLRMAPIPSAEPADRLPLRHYTVVTTLLDDSLSYSPSPSEPVWTNADIRDHQRLHGRTQRRRTTLLGDLQASGSIGSITDVSLALINAADLEPSATLLAARAARIGDPRGELQFRRWGCLNTLSWIEGVLRTSIECDQGRYDDGQLTLHGAYPASLAIGCKGRPLAAIMDHPALRTSGAVIASANVTEDAFILRHRSSVTFGGRYIDQ